MNDDFDSEDEQEKDEEEARTSRTGLVRPIGVCPIIVQPEIDIEIAVHPSGPSVPPNKEPPSVDGTLSAHTVSPGEQFPYMSSETTLQTNSSFVLCASESVRPNKSQPLPRLHCELGNQTSEVPIDSSPCALPPASTPSLQRESRPRSDGSQAGGGEIPPSEASLIHLPTTETNPRPTTGEDGSTDSPVGHPRLELPAESVASPTATRGFEREVAVGLSELVAGLSEGSTGSAANDEGGTAELLSPVAESEASLGAEGETPPPPELAENVGQKLALQSSSAWEEKEDAPQISPDTLLLFENPPNALSEGSEIQSERDANRTLMPPVIFLSAVVSLSVVLQEPSALFIMGLLLVLHRF
ncbi:uncharacterized protein [Cebidichthys violaceus]|uniref:uncharacterized protein isoform X2 n=1 Tax=Cebidichthys violaceus TaxID=271503 RepID=UPI0035CAFABF